MDMITKKKAIVVVVAIAAVILGGYFFFVQSEPKQAENDPIFSEMAQEEKEVTKPVEPEEPVSY